MTRPVNFTHPPSQVHMFWIGEKLPEWVAACVSTLVSRWLVKRCSYAQVVTLTFSNPMNHCKHEQIETRPTTSRKTFIVTFFLFKQVGLDTSNICLRPSNESYANIYARGLEVSMKVKISSNAFSQ